MQSLRLGLTTAFEQGVFATLETQLNTRVETLRLVRQGSPDLVRQVRRGKLDAAVVVLPLEAVGLAVTPIDWHEPLIAALPAIWPEADRESVP